MHLSFSKYCRLSTVQDSHLIHQLQYSELILNAEISEPALLALTMEILATRGPLPVGEIGKLLAETTSIPNLSHRLKDRYNGLKKFLELYPNDFVISNDHPFNPSVVLRCVLSQENLEMIERGIYPHQMIARAKKVRFVLEYIHKHERCCS